VRSENQDAYGRFPAVADQETGERLFIVADGMGGHARGGEASRLAVDVLQETFFAGDDGAVGERLERAFEAANLRVYALGHTGPTQTITGTTCTVIALVDGHLHMAHVGDSRAYRIDKHGIEQLTRDHTLVEELLEVDVLEARPVEAAQHYLLCSDGLAPVSEEEIRQVVLTYPPQQACEHLVEMANQRGGPDNVTVLIVAINRS
jgi:serine/threonine protein phosphatase PrpC